MPVIDASALAGWLLPDEDGPDLSETVAGAEPCIVPTLLWVEFRNILLVLERRGRIEAAEADRLLELIDDLGFTVDATPSSQRVMGAARRRGLTSYDAMYLDLAARRGMALITLDRKLARAAEAEGVRAIA